MIDYFTIGKIIDAHGIRGELKLYPDTNDLRRFSYLKKCFFEKDENKDVPSMGPFEVEYARNHNGIIILKLKGMDDRTPAEKLKGLYVKVKREDAAKLNKGEYYIADMIGTNMVDDTLGQLGVVADVYETGANYIIEVKRKGKKNLLVPFLNSCVYEVNIGDGIIKVRLPDGLYELYE